MISFASVEQLNNYTEKINRFEKGEIAYIKDTDQFFTYDGEQWTKSKTEGLSLNLYDLNKMIIQQMEEADNKKIETFINRLNDYNKSINSNYYMLLCKDISYYTVFTNGNEFETFGEAVITCAQDVGKVINADLTEDNRAVEIWVRNEAEEVYCMYLFDCQQMIVTYGG